LQIVLDQCGHHSFHVNVYRWGPAWPGLKVEDIEDKRSGAMNESMNETTAVKLN
jgi:hypothetical protein